MATTYMSDMINPEVMGDMINAKVDALLKMTPYAKVDTTLQGVPGDTKTIPSWNYIGDAEDVAEGQEVDLTSMSAATRTFTIKKAMKAVGITQEAINSGLGDPIGQAETQLAKSIAGKVEKDVQSAALETSVVYDGTAGAISYGGIVRAIGIFGDEEETDKVMFIHPEQETTLRLDENFLSADKYTAGVRVTGAIGMIAGTQIKKSKRVPKVAAVTAVQGVYKWTLAAAAIGDKITVQGKTYTCTDAGSGTDEFADGAASSVATALAALLNAETDPKFANYTWSTSTTTLIATEDSGKYGSGRPVIEAAQVAGSGTIHAVYNAEGSTKGVKAVGAHYDNVIIKLEPDSPDTEFTETELPALTILLKKDTQTTAEFKARAQTHEITTARYYGVALTNEAKVVRAMFAVS